MYRYKIAVSFSDNEAAFYFIISSMKLQTNQLRDFLRRSTGIQPSSTYPITDHILIQPGKISKTNVEVSCSMNIEGGETILVEEKTLAAVVNNTNNMEVTITDKGKKVTIDDAYMPLSHAVTDPTLYPQIPSLPESIPFLITPEISSSLSDALKFVSDNPNTGPWRYVNVCPDHIAATDGTRMYYDKVDSGLSLLLSDNMVKVISSLKECKLYDDERHFFIAADGIIFSFTKIEGNSPDFNSLINHFSSNKGESFIIEKSVFTDFCERVMAISSSVPALCEINNKGLKLINAEKDASYNIDLPDISFKFSPKVLLPAIRVIDVDDLLFTQSGKALVVNQSSKTYLFQGQV